MSESFYFPVYSGLLTPQHREKIGPAIWEFLWLVSKVTKEEQVEDETWGIVLGGRPVKLAEIAAELGGSERTVKRNIARLKEEGYIETVRAPYGEIYKVRKSKKFVVKKRSAKIGISVNEREDKNGTSEKREVPHLSKRSAKNGTCNKDIKDIKKEEEEEKSMSNNSAFQLIANKFIQRRGRGLVLSAKDEIAIERLLSDNIPLDTILKLIDEVFDDYEPKHRMDYIQTFEYVEKGILDRYYNNEKANGKKDNLQVLDEIARKYGVN